MESDDDEVSLTIEIPRIYSGFCFEIKIKLRKLIFSKGIPSDFSENHLVYLREAPRAVGTNISVAHQMVVRFCWLAPDTGGTVDYLLNHLK